MGERKPMWTVQGCGLQGKGSAPVLSGQQIKTCRNACPQQSEASAGAKAVTI